MTTTQGFRTLLRVDAKSDRTLSASWLAVLAVTTWVSVDATKDLYSTPQSLAGAASAINSTPAVTALYGRVTSVGSLGELAILKPFMLGAIAVSAVAASVAIRHTRADEETGRTDLLIASGAGRKSPMIAGCLSAAVFSAIAGLGVAAVLLGLGLPTHGSMMVGANLATLGILFGVVGACCAQAFGTGRTARSASYTLIGLCFLIRAVADSTSSLSWVRWLSPLGWSQQTQPYAGERWWPMLLHLACAGLITLWAWRIDESRDVGEAPWSRSSVSSATDLHSHLGLAWRSLRSGWYIWAAGITALSLVVGNVAANADTMLSDSGMNDYLERLDDSGAAIDTLYSAELTYIGLLATAFGIHAMVDLVRDEAAGRADLLLTAAPSRSRWLGAHLVVAFVGTATLMGISGGILAVGEVIATGDNAHAGRIFAAAMGQVPAIWAICAVATVLVGITRHAGPWAWALLVAVMVTSVFGPLIDVDVNLAELSPFSHTPTVTGSQTLTPAIGMIALAAALALTGSYVLKHRDIG